MIEEPRGGAFGSLPCFLFGSLEVLGFRRSGPQGSRVARFSRPNDGESERFGGGKAVMTWILYHLVVCPYRNGNASRVRRGSFTIWSNRKTLKP